MQVLLILVNLFLLLMFANLLRSVNSNKPLYPVDVCKSVRPVDACKPICLVDIRKNFFVDYWKHVILFLILLLFVVSVNSSVSNRIILYMIIFINIHIYLIFNKFFKWKYVILIDYFSFFGGILFKYLILGIFIICKHLFKLFLIIFVINFAFINIF